MATPYPDDKLRQHGPSLWLEVVLEHATPAVRAEVVAAIKTLLAQRNFGRSSVRVDIGRRERRKVVKASLARGEEVLVKWTQDGTLVPVATVESAWGIKRQSVDAARKRNEIFSVYVRGQHWYPAEALKFQRASLTKVLHCLGDQSAASKLMFLKKRHGGLGTERLRTLPTRACCRTCWASLRRTAQVDVARNLTMAELGPGPGRG